MIRLEGATLPPESQGAIPPILFGDLLRDVPGIPLQVGWAAVLADNCGIDASVTTLRLGGADLAETLAAVPTAGVVQLEQEWISYSAILSGPPRLTIAARGYAGTTAAVHAKGTAVYFVETRPLYAFAYVPPGCTYPDDALVQLRVQDNAETPPATVRLQDDRLVPGVRLVTVEFDASHAFLMPPPPPLPSQAVVFRPFSPGASGAAQTGRMGGGGAMHGMSVQGPGAGRSRPTAHDPRMRILGPAPPTLRGDAAAPPDAPFAGQTGSRITLRQGALGTVTADLKGLRDTAAGRYSGVGLGPLVQPAAIVRLLLEETYGETDPARYHAPTWTATAAQQAVRGITWRLVWTGEPFEAFREAAQLCGQADLYLDEDGRWRYAFRDPQAAAVATLTPRELLAEPGLAWTAGRDVITELEVAWGAGLQGGTVTLASPTMAVRHGRNHGGVAFAYAASAPIARRLGQYQLRRRDRPRQSATVRACPATLGLTLGDKIHLDTPLLTLYAEARTPFEIVGITDRGDQRVLVCLEADPLALEVFGAGVGTATMVGLIEVDTLSGAVMASGVALGLLTTVALAGAGGATGTLVGSLTTAGAAALLAGAAGTTSTLTGDLLTAGPSGPAFINTLTVGDTSPTASPTVFTFTPGAGTNYVILRWFGAAANLTSAVCVPTGGGTTVNLAVIPGTSDPFRMAMWGGGLLPGQEYTITATWSNGSSVALAISAYSGVGSVTGGTFTTTGPPANLSFSVGAVTGLVVDCGAGAGASQTLVPGAGQTAEAAQSHDGSNASTIRASYKGGTGTVTTSWTSPSSCMAFGAVLLPP